MAMVPLLPDAPVRYARGKYARIHYTVFLKKKQKQETGATVTLSFTGDQVFEEVLTFWR